MSHHGSSRHTRYTRLMRRKRLTDGYEQSMDQNPEQHGHSSSRSTMLYGSDIRGVGGETAGMIARSDEESAPEKRRQTVDADDQTTVLARVISTVDQDSDPDTTATAQPTRTSDVELDRSTTSHTSSDPTSVTHSDRSTADNASSETSTVTSASLSSSTGELPTASPGYSSPTADTPTMTTGHDTSTTDLSSPTGNSTVQLSTQTSRSIISPTAISASSSHRVSSSSAVSTSRTSSNTTTTYSTTSSSTTSSVMVVWTTTESAPTSFTGDGWGNGGADATSTTATAAPKSTDLAAGGSGSLDSQTKGKIAGGVVGGVAGALILLLVAFLLFRRRKAAARKPVQEALPAGPETGTALGAESVSRSAEMASRRSSNDPLFTASYFAPAFMKRWRQSNQTTRTDSTLTSSTSERGFQKISGRKIPSVLQSGGDGYGGGFEAGSPTTSEPSTIISPPSPVYPRSPTQPPPSVPYGMPLDASYTREAEESDSRVIFRPSPARTPVAGSASASLSNEPTSARAVPQASGALSPTIPKRPDMLGRSHPSFDGSRGSRFSENL